MVLPVRHTNIITIIIFVNLLFSVQKTESSFGHELISTTNLLDWRRFEALAEEHPYIVALLSGMKDYVCTGSVINKVCVLTSGNCVTYDPKYVAVNTAVYNKKLSNNTIFTISATLKHGDYMFQLKTADPNLTRMHSNIGLVFVDRPLLEYFINVADLGNFYASELKDMDLTAIGYGNLGSSNLVGLQYQIYHQTACMNPKWYYCVCGIEAQITTYVNEFGQGGPILLGSALVGISAAPCGTLLLRNLGVKYNAFTVVGPYLPWVEKSKESVPNNYPAILRSRGVSIQRNMFLKHFHLLVVVSKMFF